MALKRATDTRLLGKELLNKLIGESGFYHEVVAVRSI